MMSRRNDKKENGSQRREDKIKELIPTRSIILSFDRSNLPSEIILCHQLFKVKQYSTHTQVFHMPTFRPRNSTM